MAPSLTLDQCVETLKGTLKGASKAQSKELASLYLASLGLLCHLKQDAMLLHKARKATNESNSTPCPSPQEIPAMTRIHQDSQLFQSLVACLKVPEATDSNTDATAPRYSRKRSYSIQSESDHAPASKMLKIQNSPKKAVISVPIARSADQSPDLPTMPVAILAATVLYSAFQHVDHWPVPLVQAYAIDSFGPRLWVDDDRCSLLVQNLALCHTNLEEQQETDLDQTVLAQAAQVAHYYENLPLEGVRINGHAVSPCPTVLTSRPTNEAARSTSLAYTGPLSAALPTDSDSDSDGEVTCLIEVSSGLLARTGHGKADDSSSSSSGMEGAEVVEMSTTIEQGPSGPPPPSRTASLASQSVASTPNPVLAFPGLPAALNLTRIRRRYLGINLAYAQKAIVTALSERLDIKSKQNSKLLMALPSFVCIPAIRRLTASHLERWLQSPALSGQARALFAATVQNMRNVNPSLPDDIEAIDSIMEMRLKANQLNMYIENVTEIAKRIPSVTAARHIFLRILREELAIMESGTHPPLSTEPMKLMNAVYGALPSSLACEGLAIAFLALLAELADKEEASHERQRERQLRMKKVRLLLQSVANALASMYDGCGLVQSLLSFDVNAKTWSLEDEEDKARLMYECVTLLVPSSAKESNMGPRGQQKLACHHSDEGNKEDIATLRTNLKKARKMLLDWCCREYAQQWQARNREKTEHDEFVKKHVKRKAKDDEVPVGAGTPDYSSVFDGQVASNKFAECLTVMRCVLFMNDAEASALREFLHPGDPFEGSDPTWEVTKYRIQQCHEYGCDLDDEMLWIILKSASLQDGGIDPSLALPLIENLFECCSNDKRSALQLSEPELVWGLYRLTEYFPCSTHTSKDTIEANGHGENRSSFPRLAYPAAWWRVTVLALIMCGASPEKIGQEMWSAIPTLRALIKMTTSGRYRFPTIDCDEAQFREMKAAEASIRDEESRIAELLFLPPVPVLKKSEASENEASPIHKRGIRASSRQREKQERLQQERREKEAAAALIEVNRRRKALRLAQKSIMLWEPKGLARKPAKEAVPLIFSAEDLFCLSKIFQQNVNPDFLLLTIGQTTRGAIERAFDWVIPVISSVPEIINRLPANASCFLLLRAYGEEGEGKSELRQLSAPLVQHVRKSLTGEFGESSAVRAADLLLADLADPNPDRRRCVIRVLRETLSQLSTGGDDDSTGLLNLLRVDHIEAIVSGAINYISKGLAYERGIILRSFVIALDRFISFATEKKTAGPWKLASIVYNLISSRQIVCAEAMDRFADFRSLAITLVHREFLEYAANKGDNRGNLEDKALIQLCPASGNDSANISVSMPLPLLQSACVLLSICKDEERSDLCTTARAAIQYIANALLYPFNQSDEDVGELAGLASATTISGDRAVSVEQWVMLAKSRSDFIAKRAALSAPTLFLPRLLLCTGLPASSLLTMIDRLGKLGDKAEDCGLVYKDLFMPSVINQWAMSYPGNRKELMRKLVGRLSAYLHSDEVSLEDTISSSFLEWLSEECSLQAKSKWFRPGKKAPKADQSVFDSLLHSSPGGYIVSMIGNLELHNDDMPELAAGSPIDLEPSTTSDSKEDSAVSKDIDANGILTFIERCRTENRSKELNDWLDTAFQDKRVPAVGMKNELSLDKICNSLLTVLFDTKHGEKGWFTNFVLEWAPKLSQLKGGPDLWKLVFSSQPSSQVAAELLRSRCASVWCQGHVQECQQWMLANHGGLDVTAILRYLIATSRQQSIHAQSFIGSTSLSEEYWGTSESGLIAGVTIAIKGAKEPCNFDVNDPVNLPDWLLMLLLLSRTGQQAMMQVCEMILVAIDQEQDAQVRSRLESAILRLYTYFPKRMKLGNPRLRGVLVESTKSGHWLSWSSSLDAELGAMLSGLKDNPSKRIIQALMDLSKSHPLLVLRKLPTMLQLLENDACVPKHRNVRGRVYGENPLGPLTATIAGKPIKIMIRHWGHSFSESLWISLLDVVMAIPKEVLFNCGLRTGLGEFLGVYAKLLFIQSQLQSNPARVKSKFSDMLNEFKLTDRKGWEAWLESKQPDLPSLDTTRNVLMSCSLIGPETSVEDLRRAMQS